MNTFARLAAALTASLLITASAQAVAITSLSAGPGTATNITATGLGTNLRVHAGIINMTVDGVAMQGFCVDPFQWAITGNDFVFADLSAAPLTKPMGAADAALISKLWDKYFTLAQGSNSVAATLQVAIWKLVGDALFTAHDSTLDGNAAAYITAAGSHGGQASLVGLTKINGQDFVVRQVPDGGITVLLLGLGLTGLALMRRRI